MCEACKLSERLQALQKKVESLRVLMSTEMIRYEAQTKLGRMKEAMGTADSAVAAMRDLFGCIADMAAVGAEIEKYLRDNPRGHGSSLADILSGALSGGSSSGGQTH